MGWSYISAFLLYLHRHVMGQPLPLLRLVFLSHSTTVSCQTTRQQLFAAHILRNSTLVSRTESILTCSSENICASTCFLEPNPFSKNLHSSFPLIVPEKSHKSACQALNATHKVNFIVTRIGSQNVLNITSAYH